MMFIVHTYFLKLLHDFTKIISPKLKEKPHLKFDIIYQDETIYADKNRITQICLNFITNAINYTHEGSIKFIIDSDEDSFTFKVKDTGVGISDNAKHRIFTPFEQVQDNSSRYGGIGLGLYLCKLIVENLKGQIGFESTQHVGSTFWFKISKKDDKHISRKI